MRSNEIRKFGRRVSDFSVSPTDVVHTSKW